MGKHASELTVQELSEAGAAAGAGAIAEAHRAGLAVTGYATKPDGELWLASLLPDGRYEWLERVPAQDERLKTARSFPAEPILPDRAVWQSLD